MMSLDTYKEMGGLALRNGNVVALCELLGDHRVHVDQQVSLRRNASISLLDHRLEPVRERLANNSISDIDHPLLRQLPLFLQDW